MIVNGRRGWIRLAFSFVYLVPPNHWSEIVIGYFSHSFVFLIITGGQLIHVGHDVYHADVFKVLASLPETSMSYNVPGATHRLPWYLNFPILPGWLFKVCTRYSKNRLRVPLFHKWNILIMLNSSFQPHIILSDICKMLSGFTSLVFYLCHV